MAGSDDRQIFERGQVLWFPEEGFDTSLGDGTLNVEVNALNAAAASIQRSVEALDQRWKDLGVDPTVNGWSAPGAAFFGLSEGNEAVLNSAIDPMRFAWNTANNDQKPKDDKLVDKVGILCSENRPFRVVVRGRPLVQTQTVYVDEVDSAGGFTINNQHISGPDAPFFAYVVAKENVGGTVKLKAYFQNSWLTESEIATIIQEDERLIFTAPWDRVRYETQYFWETNEGDDEPKGDQASFHSQFNIKEFRDYSFPHRTNPQLFFPRGATQLVYVNDFEDFNRGFKIITEGGSTFRIGKPGRMWEGWRALDQFKGLYNMANAFPRGWDFSPGTINDVGGSESAFSEEIDSVQNPGYRTTVQQSSGENVTTDTHKHEVSIVPPFATFLFLIKV